MRAAPAAASRRSSGWAANASKVVGDAMRPHQSTTLDAPAPPQPFVSARSRDVGPRPISGTETPHEILMDRFPAYVGREAIHEDLVRGLRTRDGARAHVAGAG